MSGISTDTADVSVVIPCYRCAGTIERAVASVIAQTSQPREIILVDDASGDGTLDVLHDIAARIGTDRVKVIGARTNGGAGTARNIGWDVARGRYVAFLDADDAFHPRKIGLQFGIMQDRPDCIMSGHLTWIHEGDGPPAFAQLPTAELPIQRVTPGMLLWRNRFSTPTVMVRRDVSLRFADGKRYSEDYHLWLRLAFDAGHVLKIDLPLAVLFKQDFGASGLSADLWKMQTGQVDTYRRIHREGLIGRSALAALLGWSWLRFLRRLMIVAVRRSRARTPG